MLLLFSQSVVNLVKMLYSFNFHYLTKVQQEFAMDHRDVAIFKNKPSGFQGSTVLQNLS